MKTKLYLCAAVIAAFAMNPAAFAAHNSAHISGPPPRGVDAKASEDSAMGRMARYPLKAGYSVLRSPLIVGETFTGKRAFFSNRGLFQTVEEPASTSTRTDTPLYRGSRTKR